MNLNAFAPHGVFETALFGEQSMATLIAARLRDGGEISCARTFPYQLPSAYQNCDSAVPQAVRAHKGRIVRNYLALPRSGLLNLSPLRADRCREHDKMDEVKLAKLRQI